MKLIALTLSLALLSPFAAAKDAKPTALPSLQDVAHLSCTEMWQESGKSVDKFFHAVETMAGYLLQSRDETFPDQLEAGKQFGERIDVACRKAPDQLLISAVDIALRETLATIKTPAK
ncbi:hypothetical protein [Deefgea salmonis]|uniref:HdeA/HdeB family protein n=1 Tax=Deefgea salmonis TaxID=2875502 RepID=A0ABS8BJZ0_9NEIS|nr:hypothetical protein [Deefgea salmonis]MCB5195846.1 hypothetical protein [Deefgea salmonis]